MANESIVEQENTAKIPIIDYEGSDYKQAFWDGQGREYEDLVERAALQQLIPASGTRIAEIGAGFGRLADLYTGYKQIILFDYSRTLLSDAVASWGHDERFIFVAGNLYELPLVSGVLDTLVMPRVMHHLADVPSALRQIERVLHSKSLAVLEYANKRNIKAIGRWLIRRQSWSPFSRDPIEYVRLNFDFHPHWMAEKFREAGLISETQYALSHFRLPLLKQKFSADRLVRVEQPFFSLAGKFPLSPSVFVTVRSLHKREAHIATPNSLSVATLFRCPNCTTTGLTQVTSDQMNCHSCGLNYMRRNQIWDFKEPVHQ